MDVSRYETRRGLTSATRLRLLENDADWVAAGLHDVKEDVDEIKTNQAVLNARVGIYAAIGAAGGSGLIAVLTAVVVYVATRHFS